ncbi:hypothetical protein BJV74DRAFT_952511 [Russula compacta]|nr:hypothetical protein BJV74DRAFT_952511 [Russula compacta]
MHPYNVVLLVLATFAASPALSSPLSIRDTVAKIDVRDVSPGQDMQARDPLSDLLGLLHLDPPAGLTDVTPNQRAARNALTDILGPLDPGAPVGLTDVITPNQLAPRDGISDIFGDPKTIVSRFIIEPDFSEVTST